MSNLNNVLYLSLATALLMSVDVLAQTSTTYQEKELNIAPLASQQPDTTGLWYHINEKQIRLANEEFYRLKAEYPRWEIPDEVITALERINGKTNPNAQSVPSQVEKPALEVQPKPEAPLEAFAALTPKARTAASTTKVKQLATLSNAMNRTDFYLLIGWTALDKNMLDVAQQQFEQAKGIATLESQKQSVEQGLNGVKGVKVQQALSLNDFEKLKQYLNNDSSGYVAQLLQGKAWNYYDAQQFELAAILFALVGDNEGQYVTFVASNKVDEAFTLACRINSETFLRRCADALAERQVRFYEAQAYSKSIDAALQLEKIRVLTLEERALLGWASKEHGDVAAATSAFEEVLSNTPQNEVIANELVTLNRDDSATLGRLALKYPQIKRQLQQQTVQNAWPRKQFLYAYLNEDERVTTAQTKDAFTTLYGVNVRQRSGQDGLGNFDVVSQYIGIGSTYDKWLWQVTFDYKQFYSGTPSQGDWFAGGQLDDAVSAPFEGISGFEDTGFRGEVLYQANAFNFYANLEYGMFSQPVDAEVTGQLSATGFFTDTTVAATLFRQAKEDSLLSQTGTFNSNHQQPWGYVIEEGARLLAAYVVAPKWSAATTAQLSTLKGDRVDDNNAFSLRFDISYDVAEDVSSYLDYWRVGPFLSYNSYDKNLSGFTYGNGGYFSPDYFVSVGGYSELLTLETLNWQLKLRSALALSRVKQQNELRFPLSDFFDDPDDALARLDYDRTTGLSGNIMAEGQYRITDKWIVAGYIGKAFAVEYQAFEAGIQIRWRQGKGTGVTSDELILSSPRRSGFAL